ncbi:MAG: hypothetical protein HC881_07570 [Leptolyngbyaceae cyanobacterium SL_7_1]|nr:hypothetical protein [Leptolyngbyaceae cyanobacterium SL_7_1]
MVLQIYSLIGVIPPLTMLYFVGAWLIVVLCIWSVWAFFKEATNTAVRMHRIPCANCHFFTGNYQLKCSVHPSIALSEAAIDCPDYRQVTDPFTVSISQSEELSV